MNPSEREIEEALACAEAEKITPGMAYCAHRSVLASAVRSLRKELEGAQKSLYAIRYPHGTDCLWAFNLVDAYQESKVGSISRHDPAYQYLKAAQYLAARARSQTAQRLDAEAERDRYVLKASAAESDLARMREAFDLMWRRGTHEVKMDSSVMFGKGYDIFGLTELRREMVSDHAGYVIWPNDKKWSAYCDRDGGMMFEKFDSERAAMDWCYADFFAALTPSVNQEKKA